MDKPKPKSRRQLNDKQKEILLILYKFRFASRDLIIKYQGLTAKTYTHYRLKILLEQEYIGRKFDGKAKIQGKPAAYYLLLNGIQILRKDSELNPKVLDITYRDKNAGEQFINHCLANFGIYTKLKDLYGKSLSFYSKSEISEYDYFLRPLPDAYIIFDSHPDITKQFIIEIIEASTPPFVTKKRLVRYIEHVESGDWDETDSSYPILLLVCESTSLETRIQKQTERLLDQSDIDELAVYTTTTKALLNMISPNDKIWSDVFEPEDPYCLGEM